MEIVKPGSSKSPAGSTSDKRLSDTTIKYLNKQIKIEAEASQIYYAIKEWCENRGYFGSAAFFGNHAEEERSHMTKVYKYLSDRDVMPITPDISAPKKQVFTGLPEAFKAAYEHEKFVTSTYNELCCITMKEEDFMTFDFSLEFIKEQREEEAKFKGHIDEMNTMGGDKKDLYMFDKSLKSDGCSPCC